jgi:outer membrane protein OmpA-like peptidoglycan-associated protein
MRVGAMAVGVVMLLAGSALAQMPQIMNEQGNRAVRGAPGASTGSTGKAQPLAAHDYLVFFPGDSAELSPAAKVVVARSAKAVRQTREAGQFGHVKVIGYSDAVSGPDAAQKLSAQRAEVVKQALVAEGVPADRIKIEGRGKPRNAAAKGDAVRELKNRRARIVLYGPGA